MIGLVIVSHSPRLAEAAVDLALQMVHGSVPPIRIAAGVEGRFGTDAAAVAAAIDEVGGADGVLVITDLGSAVLSAGLALELTESGTEVIVSGGPFVEGITAGVVLAATGAPLAEVAREVSSALDAKLGQLEPLPGPMLPASPVIRDPRSADEVLINPEGLHARPAAMFVQAVGGYDAVVDVTNLTTGHGPVAAKSLIGLLSLGAKQGHRLRLDGQGPDAATAVGALRRLLADGFGEVTSARG
jgi:phosphoenolpyruvate---glycerone phosphotransferase subunit DhaM